MEDARKILADTFRLRLSEVTDSLTMDEVDTWDSLTHMELVANLEAGLTLEFDGDEIAEMTSVGAILALIEKKKHGNRG